MNIAVITNKPYKDCETFIKAQIDNLPFEIHHYWGRKLPYNLMVSKPDFWHRLFSKFGFIEKPTPIEVFSNELQFKNVQLVLAQYGPVGDTVLEVCKRLNIPLVVHFHGHDAVRKSVLKEYDNYKRLFTYSKLTVISVSHEMTKRLIAKGCPENKIIYNVYGPANKFLELVPNYSKKQFISIGRFVDKKAPHLTILAFSEVVKIHKDVTLVYAGDDVLLGSCKDLVVALNLTDNVIFPGRITPEDYQNYLMESMAYVQHSIEAQDGDMEGTPVSILEASAAGLPIVSTLHAGIPDVILHEETGLLSKEKDIEAMTEHMLWVLENKKEATEMGLKGKARIRSNYSMTHHIDNLAGIIKKAIV